MRIIPGRYQKEGTEIEVLLNTTEICMISNNVLKLNFTRGRELRDCANELMEKVGVEDRFERH